MGNADLKGAYSYASMYLKKDERPWAWFQAKIDDSDYVNFNLMITSKAFLLFTRSVRAKSIELNHVIPLNKINEAMMTNSGRKYADFRLILKNDQIYTFKKIPKNDTETLEKWWRYFNTNDLNEEKISLTEIPNYQEMEVERELDLRQERRVDFSNADRKKRIKEFESIHMSNMELGSGDLNSFFLKEYLKCCGFLEENEKPLGFFYSNLQIIKPDSNTKNLEMKGQKHQNNSQSEDSLRFHTILTEQKDILFINLLKDKWVPELKHITRLEAAKMIARPPKLQRNDNDQFISEAPLYIIESDGSFIEVDLQLGKLLEKVCAKFDCLLKWKEEIISSNEWIGTNVTSSKLTQDSGDESNEEIPNNEPANKAGKEGPNKTETRTSPDSSESPLDRGAIEEQIQARRKLAKNRTKPDREKIKKRFQTLATHGDFSYYHEAIQYLKEEESPWAWIDVGREDYSSANLMITDRYFLFFDHGWTMSSFDLKDIIPIDKVEKIVFPKSIEKVAFSIVLDRDRNVEVFGRASNIPEEILEEIKSWWENHTNNTANGSEKIDFSEVNPSKEVELRQHRRTDVYNINRRKRFEEYEDIIKNEGVDLEAFVESCRYLDRDEVPLIYLEAALVRVVNEGEEFDDLEPSFRYLMFTNQNILFFSRKDNEVKYSIRREKALNIARPQDLHNIIPKIIIRDYDGTILEICLNSVDIVKSACKEFDCEIKDTEEILSSNISDLEFQNANTKKSQGKQGSENPEKVHANEVSDKKSLMKEEGEVDLNPVRQKNIDWQYKIISGPILSGEEQLIEKLNQLGKQGWELVDTQRHSIMGSQHAVCFLKKPK